MEKLIEGVKMAGSHLCKEFTIDRDNETQIRQMATWFLEMELGDIDASKGLFVVGNVGTGKSMLFEIFKLLMGHLIPRRKFYRTITCREVVKNFATDGPKTLDEYSKIVSKVNFGETQTAYINWLFDELSEASQGISYGQRANVMADLIEDRYLYWQRYGAPTHFTSNLLPKQIAEVFGDRVESRICQMCNIIVLTGKDRRK